MKNPIKRRIWKSAQFKTVFPIDIDAERENIEELKAIRDELIELQKTTVKAVAAPGKSIDKSLKISPATLDSLKSVQGTFAGMKVDLEEMKIPEFGIGLEKAFEKAHQSIIKYNNGWENLQESMKLTVAEGVATGDSLKDIISDIASHMKRELVFKSLLGSINPDTGKRSGGLFGAIGGALSGASFGPIGALVGGLAGIFKANGGPVSGRSPYIVGERGPELFIPSSHGNITPNHMLGSGGAPTIVNNNHFDIRGGEQELQRMISRAVEVSVKLSISETQNLKNRGALA